MADANSLSEWTDHYHGMRGDYLAATGRQRGPRGESGHKHRLEHCPVQD